MPIDSKKRKELSAAANRLSATITVSAQEPPESTIAHVRAALSRAELVKVRISTDERDECRLIAAALAEKLGCDLVQVVGRVVTLYQSKPA